MRNAVANFLRGLLKSGEPLYLGIPPEKDNLLRKARDRKEWAESLLQSRCFQDAIQFLNEQVLRDIASTDALDSDTLKLLRLRLEVISEFPQVLEQFISEYETIVLIQDQQEDN